MTLVSSPQRRIYLATKNAGKITEIQQILGSAWEIRTATHLSPDIDWSETGTTFEENAKIKAIEVSKFTQEAILAEDSGLCVDALNGAPGVYANRYAGKEGDSEANMQKLLVALAGLPWQQRSAAFVCCVVYIDKEGNMQSFEGRCAGHIAEAPRGQHGFGYDPIFIPQDFTRTMAELTAEEKNAISHRRQALEKWLRIL